MKAYEWLRDMVDLLERGESTEEFYEHSKLNLYQDQVFCFTPKGMLIALPRGATPIDFAYFVHTDVGNTAIGAKINGVHTPLHTTGPVLKAPAPRTRPVRNGCWRGCGWRAGMGLSPVDMRNAVSPCVTPMVSWISTLRTHTRRWRVLSRAPVTLWGPASILVLRELLTLPTGRTVRRSSRTLPPVPGSAWNSEERGRNASPFIHNRD